MSDHKGGSTVPSWDGSARTWRRYTREVAWWVQATPVHKRRYCASQLLGKLTGPARLLAMSWSRLVLDSQDGTRELLQRLAASPLVRKTLPNAAAICQQYFAFKRNTQETIGNFLVRETLVHEEFIEAIIRLHEEKVGVSQESRDFGLPPTNVWSDDRGWSDDQWRDDSWWWYSEDYGDLEDYVDYEDAAGDADLPGDSPLREPGVPADGPAPSTRDDSGHGPGPPGATGSSPSHQGDAATPSPADPPPSRLPPPRRGLADVASQGVSAMPPQAIDELSMADSFIMGVLRGWRLLQAAGLTAEEKRDILSTTKNSLDYEVVAAALQNLWDDQLLGQRYPHSSGYSANYANTMDDMDLYYQDQEEWWPSGEDWWYDGYYHDQEWPDPSWWEDDWSGPQPQESFSVVNEPENPVDEAKLKEAQQAERVAESLAVEAQRTWSEARRATQALRKDRGFGSAAMSSLSNGVKCFLCGGNHLARDCPDRRHPGFSKGNSKGKFGYYSDQDYDHSAYFSGKGKSKGKFKGKRGYWLEAQAMKGKGSGKTKGKSMMKDPGRSVNAYTTDLFAGGLELSEALDLNSAHALPSTPQKGMLDCGATASAAPEAVVQNLISTVLSHDPGARIELDQSARPYFRFGNGKWGRALCRVHLHSKISGSPSTLHCILFRTPLSSTRMVLINLP